MSKPLISVIIPTYNRKELCRRAVTSVQKQTYQNFEIIVVDDGSDDGTSRETLLAGKSYDLLHYIRHDLNYGVSHARNSGVAQARGEWIAFLDSDDEWHPEKLNKQFLWMQNNPSYIVNQTKEIWIRKGKRVNPPKTHEKIAGHIFKESLQRCMITPSSVLIKKDLFNSLGGFNEALAACEDYDLWLRLCLDRPVGLVDEYLLTRHGGRGDQLSASVETLDKYRIRSLLDLLAHKSLIDEQRHLVQETLIQKASIVAAGALKRKKVAEYERYKSIADRYRASL